MCLRQSGKSWFLLYFLLLSLLLVSAQAKESIGAPPTSSSTSSDDSTTSSSTTSAEAWRRLLDEWQTFEPIWIALMTALEKSEIGIAELPSYLTSMQEQLETLKSLWDKEIQARLRAEQSRDRWRLVVFIGVPAAFLVGGGISIWILR